MRVTTVSYKKIFPGEIQFTNTTLGLEIAVNEGENVSDAFDLAKRTVEEWMNPRPLAPMFKSEIKYSEPIPEINRNDEKIEIAIDNAQTIEELNALSKNLPVHLMTTFVNKLTELKKQ